MRLVQCLLIVMLAIASPLGAEEASQAKQGRQLAREVIGPLAYVEAGASSGSGTVIFSAYIERHAACPPQKPLPERTWCVIGSGARESHTYVLTNWHVVQNRVIFEGQEKKGQKGKPQRKKRGETEKPKRELRRLPVKVGIHRLNDENVPMMQMYDAEIVHYDAKADLALLRVAKDAPLFPHVTHLAPRNALDNFYAYSGPEDRYIPYVWAVGYPLGIGPVLTSGWLTWADDGDKQILNSAAIYFGNSGGGLYHFSWERGRFELIGVPVAVATTNEGVVVSQIAYAVPLKQIYQFLEQNRLGFIAPK